MKRFIIALAILLSFSSVSYAELSTIEGKKYAIERLEKALEGINAETIYYFYDGGKEKLKKETKKNLCIRLIAIMRLIELVNPHIENITVDMINDIKNSNSKDDAINAAYHLIKNNKKYIKRYIEEERIKSLYKYDSREGIYFELMAMENYLQEMGSLIIRIMYPIKKELGILP